MSLINQVLLDLDRRHAVAGAVPMAVRSVPSSSRPSGTPARPIVTVAWLSAFTVLGAGSGLAFFGTQAASGDGVTPAPAVALAHEVAPARPIVIEATPIAPVELRAASVPAAPVAAPVAVASVPVLAPAVTPALPPTVTPATTPAIEPKASSAIPPSIAAPLPEARVEKRMPPPTAGERAQAEYERGIGLHRQGQTQTAMLAFTAALREERGHVPARQALSVELVGEGRLDEAQALLAEGLELDPRNASLAIVLARVKAERQDVPGAIAVLKAALPGGAALRDDAPAARALLATLLQRTGDHAGAIEHYVAALKQVPGNGTWWIGLGISLAAQGRADASKEAFTRAQASDSLSPDLARYVEQRLRATAP